MTPKNKNEKMNPESYEDYYNAEYFNSLVSNTGMTGAAPTANLKKHESESYDEIYTDCFGGPAARKANKRDNNKKK